MLIGVARALVFSNGRSIAVTVESEETDWLSSSKLSIDIVGASLSRVRPVVEFAVLKNRM